MAVGTYYVDDGGDGTQTNDSTGSWATADTSVNALITLVTSFETGDKVYFGHNHICQATNSANLVITGPTSGQPAIFISATQGSNPVAYQASTTYQIDTTEGAYDLTFDGSFALYGISVAVGDDLFLSGDSNEITYTQDFRAALSANNQIFMGNEQKHYNLTLDLTADGTTSRANSVIECIAVSHIEIHGLSFVNLGYRTGSLITLAGGFFDISGANFTNLQSTTEIFNGDTVPGKYILRDSLTESTWTAVLGTLRTGTEFWIQNCGPAAAPTYLYHQTWLGLTISTTSIYRTGGGTLNGTAAAFLITTTATCSESSPFYSPWLYGNVAATGSKTFDVYITNDSQDFTNAEAWLEVEYLGTASEAISSFTTDQRATIVTTAASQTDDTTSTWNGTGPSFNYKQKLSVTATVNVAGPFRARVAFGHASILSSEYCYVDSTVVVG